MVEFLAWMCEHNDGILDSLHLDYLVLAPQIDDVWFVKPYEYWKHDCDFEMHMHRNRQVSRCFVG